MSEHTRAELWPLDDAEVAYTPVLAGQAGVESMEDVDYCEIPATVVDDLSKANLLTSRLPMLNPADKDEERYHQVALDIDVPARLIPSTTEGNHHLLIAVDGGIPERSYFKLLDALVDCGVIEEGYAEACKNTGFTTLRLPWIKKHGKYVNALYPQEGYDVPTPLRASFALNEPPKTQEELDYEWGV